MKIERLPSVTFVSARHRPAVAVSNPVVRALLSSKIFSASHPERLPLSLSLPLSFSSKQLSSTSMRPNLGRV